MPLAMRDRVRLIRQVLDAVAKGTLPDDVPAPPINLVLHEAGLDEVDLGYDFVGEVIARRLSDAPDQTLVEVYSAVFDVDVTEVLGAAAAADPSGLWRPDTVRLFLSHSAHHKGFATDVANELAVVGVHAFVAHEDIEPTRQWQEQIVRALNTAEVFAGLVHPEVNDSAWCHQEIGWALGRGLPMFFLRLGPQPPRGFPGATQWGSASDADPMTASTPLIGWLTGLPGLSDRITGGMFEALRTAGNYYDAEAAARRIDAMGRLSPAQFAVLDRIFLENNQVGNSVLATRALRPLYQRHGRSFPDEQTVTA
ncbi:MAG TPA: toll/interleukin-1 receptor domain-containing protein [Mycobacteriales bacterium]|jgi:hypothetical protein|nr:toll/interleukin-1 receptor domain-containing protein [Mycobacteriales bacterium]